MTSLIIFALFSVIGGLAYNAFKPESKPRFSEYQLRQRAKCGYAVDYAPNNY